MTRDELAPRHAAASTVTHAAGILLAATWLASPHPLALASVACGGGVRHPVELRVQALDQVRHGATVRLRLTATSAIAVRRLDARLVSTGGTTLLSADRALLGPVGPGGRRETEFRVVVPPRGRRFLVQIRVEGEGPSGRIARGATYNLLPGGRLESGREVLAGDGRALHEVSARRTAP